MVDCLTSLVGIVKSALTHLALTVPEAWKSYPSEAFPVLRILVGDCNLEKDEAANGTQDVDPAPISHLQQTCGRGQWEVVSTANMLSGDMMFVNGPGRRRCLSP